MKVQFYKIDGTQNGEREYPIPEFEGNQGIQLLKEVILAYRANARQGNACTKTRGDVKGSGKKPFRQKGTGMARQGEKRSPIARGGGVVFGPKPRNFSVRFNKKEKRLALQRALFDSVTEGKLFVLEELKPMQTPKTAEMSVILEKMVPEDRCLLLDNEFSKPQWLSLRNLSRFSPIDMPSVNALDFTLYPHIIATDRALTALLEKLKREK